MTNTELPYGNSLIDGIQARGRLFKKSGMVTIISIMVQTDPTKNELCIVVHIDPTT